MRIEWLLPILFGVLGSAVFLIRNINDPRKPAQDLPGILSRILPGGISALVMGWFTISASSTGQIIPSHLSFPLMVAFLTGYIIDAVFGLLDRPSNTLGKSNSSHPHVPSQV